MSKLTSVGLLSGQDNSKCHRH